MCAIDDSADAGLAPIGPNGCSVGTVIVYRKTLSPGAGGSGVVTWASGPGSPAGPPAPAGAGADGGASDDGGNSNALAAGGDGGVSGGDGDAASPAVPLPQCFGFVIKCIDAPPSCPSGQAPSFAPSGKWHCMPLCNPSDPRMVVISYGGQFGSTRVCAGAPPSDRCADAADVWTWDYTDEEWVCRPKCDDGMYDALVRRVAGYGLHAATHDSRIDDPRRAVCCPQHVAPCFVGRSRVRSIARAARWLHSSTNMHHGLRSVSSSMILLLVGAGAGATACSSPSASSVGEAWQCAPDEVPEGVVTRCTSSAPASAPSTGGDPTSGGFGSNASTGAGGAVQPRTYGAPPPEADAGAPPPPSTPTGGSSSGTGDGSTSYDCGPGMTGPDCPGSAPTPPAPTPGAPVDECSYTPDLPYCSAPSMPTAPPPPSSGASDGGASGGGWQCTKGAMGDKTCTTAPTCSPGTHAAPCGACVDDDAPLPADCVPPSQGGCWVTGGGFIEPATAHLTYGGNAKPMKQGYVSGHWNHLDHATQDHLNGRPSYIFCRVDATEPGPGQPGGKKGLVYNQVYFGGPAKWGQGGGAEGFWFDVVAEDHGNGHQSAAKGQDPDSYHLTVRKMDDPAGKVSGPVVYDQKGDVVGGKIQIHPPNPGHDTASPPAPPWVVIEAAP